MLLGVFGLYFLNTLGAEASTSSEVSSLKSASAVASDVIVAQQSTISCLQSEVHSLENTTSESGISAANSSAAVTSCVQTSGAYRSVNITGSLTVPTGSGLGNLVVTVWDGVSIPIAGISVNVTVSGLRPESGFPTFAYNGQPVSITNPLPEHVMVSGNATLVSGTAGLFVSYGYTFQVTVTFQDGVVQTQTLFVRAEV